MIDKKLETDFFVHEKAICESISVGKGTRIWPFSHVLPGALIGKDCNICEQVFVEGKAVVGNGCTIKNGVSIWNGVTLEDDVFVGPNAVFTNDHKPRAFIKKDDETLSPTLIKKGATIGANATIVCGITIGEYAFVAAGAVVTKNVLPYQMVAGNPARVMGRVSKEANRVDN